MQKKKRRKDIRVAVSIFTLKDSFSLLLLSEETNLFPAQEMAFGQTNSNGQAAAKAFNMAHEDHFLRL